MSWFFYVMGRPVKPQGKHRRGSEKQKFIILTGPRSRRHSMPHRATWGKPQVIRRQKAGRRNSDARAFMGLSSGKTRRAGWRVQGWLVWIISAGFGRKGRSLVAWSLALGWLRQRNSAQLVNRSNRGGLARNQLVYILKACFQLSPLFSLRIG